MSYNIITYGWNKYQSTQNNTNQINENEIGRIISIKGTIYTLATQSGELKAELTGQLLYTLSKEELPKVGDWVQFIAYDTSGIILSVLSRFNSLFRKTPGKQTSKQIIAANIDKAIIIQGLDNDFNLMRLERYIAQVISCNITPVIILNKADLVGDKQKYIHEVKKLQRDTSIYLCSTYNNEGIDVLRNELFEPEKTYVFIGSSGVGKSSLLNAISGTTIRATNIISDTTGKGKHTTTTRDLFVLTNGSLVIDTPGMREFGIGFDEDSNQDETFPIISEYAKNCRYTDCKHINESGCAVIAAYEDGEIEPVVYESYIKLMKEQQHFEKSIHEKRREGKIFGKMVKEVSKNRKKYKY